MHFVYIIYSSRLNIYYKGYTSNTILRLTQHNEDRSRYTAGKGPWTLVYVETFATKAEALQREKVIKRLNRTSIEKLISTGKM